jgi:thiamine pyrophosphate-dependent acetolactate synthase large subunit-like protein
MNGAELLVAALENEGVRRIFGVPGERYLVAVPVDYSENTRVLVTELR